MFTFRPKKTRDNFELVIGLGVGVPLFFITLLVIAICIVLIAKKRRKYESSFSEDR